MASKDEQWREAYEWMQQHGDRMPDAIARARDHLLKGRPRYIVPPTPPPIDLARPPDMGKAADFKRAYASFPDFTKQYMGTFDDNLGRLPDSFSDQIGQQGFISPQAIANIKRMKKLIDQAWKGREPEPQAAYVDPDGAQHPTGILEDTDEMCPCGATWRHDDCEHI